MTVKELYNKLGELIRDHQGNKPIYLEGHDENLEIDSVQKDTNPNVEANYYFLMPGGRV